MAFTVLSDFLISFAMNDCLAEGSCCMILSTATSSKVQFLHFVGSGRAEFALCSEFFIFCESVFALWPQALASSPGAFLDFAMA